MVSKDDFWTKTHIFETFQLDRKLTIPSYYYRLIANEKTSYEKSELKSFPLQLFCLEIFFQAVKNPIRALLESY